MIDKYDIDILNTYLNLINRPIKYELLDQFNIYIYVDDPHISVFYKDKNYIFYIKNYDSSKELYFNILLKIIDDSLILAIQKRILELL